MYYRFLSNPNIGYMCESYFTETNCYYFLQLANRTASSVCMLFCVYSFKLLIFMYWCVFIMCVILCFILRLIICHKVCILFSTEKRNRSRFLNQIKHLSKQYENVPISHDNFLTCTNTQNPIHSLEFLMRLNISKANIWTQKGWQWAVEKVSQWGSS